MIISFGGSIGSGKSGIAKRLAEKLGWPLYDMGDVRRRMAQEREMTLEEFNKLGESDPRTDTEVDEYQTKLGQAEDNFIIVGRTSWHFIPQSLKIFLKAKPEIGAARVFKSLQGRNEGRNLETIEAVLESNKKRVISDGLRYQKYFQIDVFDETNYDWVLDTSDLTEDDVFKAVLSFVQEKMV